MDARTIEISNKLKGKLISTDRTELSADGKMLTTTTSYPGVARPEILIYERR